MSTNIKLFLSYLARKQSVYARAFNYIAVISLFIKLLGAIFLFLFFNYEEQTIRAFIAQLGLCFFIVGIIYSLIPQIIEHCVNIFLVRLLSIRFLINGLLYDMFQSILADHYFIYFGVEGTNTEPLKFEDKFIMRGVAIMYMYFFPFTLIFVSILCDFPYVFFILYSLFLLVVKLIVRSIDFVQPNIINLENYRLLITDTSVANELIFNKPKFNALSLDVQTMFCFLYEVSKHDSGDRRSKNHGWFLTFMLYSSFFFQYDEKTLMKLFSPKLVAKILSYKDHSIKAGGSVNKEFNDNLENSIFYHYPRLDEKILLAVAPSLGLRETFTKAAVGTAGAGSVSFAFYELKKRRDFKFAKEINKEINKENRSTYKEMLEDHFEYSKKMKSVFPNYNPSPVPPPLEHGFKNHIKDAEQKGVIPVGKPPGTIKLNSVLEECDGFFIIFFRKLKSYIEVVYELFFL
jgi:hypothetical protein